MCVDAHLPRLNTRIVRSWRQKKHQAVIFVDAGPLVHGIGIRYQFSVAAVFGHVYERTGGMMNKLCHVPCTLQLIGNSMNKL